MNPIRTAVAMAPAMAALAISAPARADFLPVASYSHENSPWQFFDNGSKLTDGVWAPAGINPADLWVGWSSAHSRTVFDLGAQQNLDSASVVFCHWSDAAVYMPTSVRFEVSDTPDFAVSSTATFLTAQNYQFVHATEILTYDLGTLPDARYVRLMADSDESWLLIGEIQFFSPVPAPAALPLLAGASAFAWRRRRAR